MAIKCPFCKGKARINHSNYLNEEKTIADLYCNCCDTQHCGATWVLSQSIKHTLNPPHGTVKQMAMTIVARMTQEEKKSLQRDMFANS